jgi:hypothetical protein
MKKLIPLLLLTGCASMIDGSTQEIAVYTQPQGAKCEVYNSNRLVGMIEATPGNVIVPRGQVPLRFVCDKKGYKTTKYLNTPQFNQKTYLSWVAGGMFANNIDNKTGASSVYETPIVIELTK